MLFVYKYDHVHTVNNHWNNYSISMKLLLVTTNKLNILLFTDVSGSHQCRFEVTFSSAWYADSVLVSFCSVKLATDLFILVTRCVRIRF